MISKFFNYWGHNLVLGIKDAWKFMGLRGIFIDLVIALIVGIILGQPHALSIALWTGLLALILYILATLVFVFLIIPFEENIGLVKKVEDSKKVEEPPELEMLGKLRSEGVEIRNKGIQQVKNQQMLSSWIEEYNDWNRRIIETLSRLSTGKAAWFETLDTFSATPISYPYIVNENHRMFLNVFTEKLRRLDMLLRDYLDIPQG